MTGTKTRGTTLVIAGISLALFLAAQPCSSNLLVWTITGPPGEVHSHSESSFQPSFAIKALAANADYGEEASSLIGGL
ncbi:hypothetical protein [Paenibacillus sp. BIHB 4019]|uniref:hypothetical protein n=1 Tax=Paenibacillus sp. BIHB 4019 TaxID=1870819 RepID=UPI0012375056|nr:hypothetical protein [Paenibacillus sp. BIHB 4019]